MQLGLKNYLDQLENTLLEIQVTNFDNVNIDLTNGIEEVTKIISAQSEKGNKVIMIGNGGSSSIASHIAVDLWKNGGVRAITFGDPALLTCVSNDLGYECVFEKPIRMFGDAGDVLIAISSSGRSENILNGVSAAEKRLCKVITMSGFKPDNPLRLTGEINFYVPSNSYGYVEIAHLVLCHCIVDIIINKNLNG